MPGTRAPWPMHGALREKQMHLRGRAMDPHARSRDSQRLTKSSEVVQARCIGKSSEQLGAAADIQRSMQFRAIAQPHGQRMMKAPRQAHDHGLPLFELASDFGDAAQPSPGEALRERSCWHIDSL